MEYMSLIVAQYQLPQHNKQLQSSSHTVSYTDIRSWNRNPSSRQSGYWINTHHYCIHKIVK